MADALFIPECDRRWYRIPGLQGALDESACAQMRERQQATAVQFSAPLLTSASRRLWPVANGLKRNASAFNRLVLWSSCDMQREMFAIISHAFEMVLMRKLQVADSTAGKMVRTRHWSKSRL